MPAQALLLREFRAGHPHLICAHGGSGKTTAALLALAEYLNPENDSGLERGRAPRTLIITPGLDVAARLCWRMDALVYPSRVNTFPARPGEDFNRRRRALVGVDFVAGPPRFLERVGDDFGLRLDSVERVIVAYFEYFAVNADELARLKALNRSNRSAFSPTSGATALSRPRRTLFPAAGFFTPAPDTSRPKFSSASTWFRGQPNTAFSGPTFRSCLRAPGFWSSFRIAPERLNLKRHSVSWICASSTTSFSRKAGPASQGL